jgi:hypothetical protein
MKSWNRCNGFSTEIILPFNRIEKERLKKCHAETIAIVGFYFSCTLALNIFSQLQSKVNREGKNCLLGPTKN